MNRAGVSSPIPSCMKDITIVHVGKRNFRVTTASLPAEFASRKDVYVRLENENPVNDNDTITIKLNVPRHLLGLIIGWGGRTVKQLNHETKTKITIHRDPVDPVSIVGTKDGVELAKKRIEDIIESANKSHNCVGNEKSDASNTKIENEKKEGIGSIEEPSIKEEKITIKLHIPHYSRGAIIGKGGYTLKKIKYETNTWINIQKNENEDSIIIGTRDGVEMAKKRIEDIIESVNKSHNNAENEKSNTSNTKIENEKKESIKESSIKEEKITIKLYIPQYSHGAIFGGYTLKKIRDETKTWINIRKNEDSIISGTKDGVETAKKRIEDIIESVNKSYNNAKNEKSNASNTKIENEKKEGVESIKESSIKEEKITIKLYIPQYSHGAIFGKGGSTLKHIRDETKTRITILKNEDSTISGTKDGVEMAKKRIEDIIKSFHKSHNNAENEKSDVSNTTIENEKKEGVESIKESSIKEEIITIKLHIPQYSHGAISGKGGNNLNQIRDETNSKIMIRPNGDSTISGTKDGVEMAKKRIENIIESVNKPHNYAGNEISDSIFKSPPTHFISLPLTDTYLQRKVETFKSDVLKLNIRGIDESILISPLSLHITIGTLHLYRKEKIEGAVKLLKSLSTEINDIIGTRTLVSILTGLAVMGDDTVKAHVLYTKVEEKGGRDTLKKLGEYLTEKFADAGYLKKENRPLKLHVTLINTRHRKNNDEYSASNNNYGSRDQSHRYPFNAVPILNKFSNIEFGHNRIESIHISKIGEHDEHGRHRSEGCIKLP